ncbi:MAG: 2-phosphosulfolactate phosphatase [Planctomycetota bacterium]
MGKLPILRARGLAGATGARGSVVVIDVLRAFTSAAYAFAGGARSLELVATPEEALARKRLAPELLLVGEIDGRPIPGFDLGNSPEALDGRDLVGRDVLLRSSSGVQGVHAARATATRIFLGSFVTAAATVRALQAAGEPVTLVAMGSPARPEDEEDEACAELFARRLAGRRDGLDELVALVHASPATERALDPACDWITPGDLARALLVDQFDFALEARTHEGRVLVTLQGRDSCRS